MRISVVIPALNEEKAIAKVIRDIPKYVDEIIVVDNGSEDRTSEQARKAGAKVIYEGKKGYGYACIAGIESVSSPDIIVFMDGDYSDYPEEMDLLVKPIVKEGYELVIGSRIQRREKGSLPPHALAANIFFGFLITSFYKVKCTDLGPFRAIKYDQLRSLNMQEKKYGWTVEMQLKAIEENYKIKEVPVRYRKRIGKSKVSNSFIESLRAAYRIFYTIMQHRFM